MIVLIIFILGLAVGSFLNVLIDRLPLGENVISGRSRCDHCRRNLRWFELIPVVSFFIQKGRCRRCHKKLSWQYPIVELITGLGFAMLLTEPAFSPLSTYQHVNTLTSLVIFSSLLVIFVADLKYQIIPDQMLIVAFVAGLFRSLPLRFTIYDLRFTIYFLSALVTAVLFFILWLVTRHRGLGLGDVKLVFVLGFLLGFPQIVVALYLAFLTGALTGVILILTGQKTLKSKIAFGPFLIFGSWLSWLGGEKILEWWKMVA